MKTRRRAAVLLAVSAVASVSALCGCGIRATAVPVDVGAAPSRVSCDTPAQPTGGVSGVQGFRATIALVCGSQLVGVERLVPVPEKRPVREPVGLVAQALLEALQKSPSAEERDAGFTTGVPEGLTAVSPRPGDPAGAVRLSRKPEDLPPVALSQIVCTLSDSDAVSAGPGPVVLGGPDADPPRAWECTDAVRSRPESVPTLGDVVRTPSPTPGPSRS
ncbi:GerMN domain-containing protein [Streptomyces sp. NPDC051183]|uniref:GerMN domain-containing protein n=1 Tax=Streptomyces sp. NPDC051183 TaxID=3155165 RepID=UPI003435C918